MKLGLHANALLLAAGLQDYQPVGRGALDAAQVLEKAAHYKFAAVQFCLQNIPGFPKWDMVTLVNLRHQADELGLTLHLAADILEGEHLTDVIRRAHTLGAKQVVAGLAELKGNVQERQRTLESILLSLDGAIKTAERYGIMLAIENGRHVAAADLAALIQAAQSEMIGVCFDMGNCLSVPENPVEAAETLAHYCQCAHMKDWHIFRTVDGVMLQNCPVGAGVVEITDVLRVLKVKKPMIPVFLETSATRLAIPLLQDEFLKQYPRITARALAGILRRGALVYNEEDMRFPHERKAGEREVLKWEEDRLKTSLKQAQKLMGTESLTLSLETV